MKIKTVEKLEMKIENDEITLERKDRCGCGKELINSFELSKEEVKEIYKKVEIKD